MYISRRIILFIIIIVIILMAITSLITRIIASCPIACEAKPCEAKPCEAKSLLPSPLPWIVYYNNQALPEAFAPYNPIILDSDHHPPIEPMLREKKTVLGYLNIAEAEDRHHWFPVVKALGLLIQENNNFAGSWAVDIRNPFWLTFLLERIIPGILKQGFSGLFFDQIDIPLNLELQDPIKYKGMTNAAVGMIKAIRKQYPTISLMMNRGYEILPQVGGEIDFELAETLYTTYDFQSKQYYIRPQNEFEWQLSMLNQGRFLFPTLVIFSLDYWDPKKTMEYRDIYSLERAQGMRPYVSTISLDEIYPEPLRTSKE